MEQGGQRCASHTREKLATKSTAVESAATAGDPAAFRVAQEDWEKAAAEYASTDEGHRHLVAQSAAAESEGDFDTSALLNTVVARGEAIRAANRETAALMKAVRLSQTVPEPSGLAVAQGVGEVERWDAYGENLTRETVVPDLSPEDRAAWTQAVTEMGQFSEKFSSVNCGVGSLSPSDLNDGLPELDEKIGNPATSDDELSMMVRRAGRYEAVKYTVPQWRVYKEDQTPQRGQIAQEQTRQWSKFVPNFVESLQAQVQRALVHPNAGAKTWKQYEKDFGSCEELTARPDAPLGYVWERMRTAPTKVDERAWHEARSARFDNNSLAVVIAANDPDSFHRNEAMNQVMMMSMDSISAKDRSWLASNLHKMPGSEENQRILASSMKTWAMGYADQAERTALGAIFLTSNLSSVSKVGSELLGHKPPEEKRGWFR